jgi:hypothetical protein
MNRPPVIYEYSDFIAEDESLGQWRHRKHLADPPRRTAADRLALALVPCCFAGAFLAAVIVFGGLA